jgi:anti-sigma factor RsiW
MNEDSIVDENALRLPFYVNGTLEEDERATLDLAMVGSAQLRAELEEIQRINALVRVGGQMLVGGTSPDHASLDRLLATIRTEQSHKSEAAEPISIFRNVRRGPDRSFSKVSRWLLPLAASIVVVLAGLATRGELQPSGDTTYITAAGADAGSASSVTSLVIVRFKPDAQWSDIEELLATRHLTFVTGPKDGRITLRLENSKDDAEKTRAALAASPLVAFAGLVE